MLNDSQCIKSCNIGDNEKCATCNPSYEFREYCETCNIGYYRNDEIDSKKNIENSNSNYKNNPQLKIEDLSCDKAIDTTVKINKDDENKEKEKEQIIKRNENEGNNGKENDFNSESRKTIK